MQLSCTTLRFVRGKEEERGEEGWKRRGEEGRGGKRRRGREKRGKRGMEGKEEGKGRREKGREVGWCQDRRGGGREELKTNYVYEVISPPLHTHTHTLTHSLTRT